MTEAFVTLATNDTYCMGALVWAHSLRATGTTRKLVVMISKDVTAQMRGKLSQVFDVITEVNVLDSLDKQNLALLTRPDLGVTFTKLHCWRLTQFTKCVFMDADTLVLQNIDELFEREEFSAAPDAGWPSCFNSGVFVYRPSEDTYAQLLKFALDKGSFDGGDQGLLNLFYHDWATKDISKHLPFIYNVVSQAFYSYLPAFKQFYADIKVAHFIGATKPWHHVYNKSTGQVQVSPSAGHSADFLQRWWNIFVEKVCPELDTDIQLTAQPTSPSDGQTGVEIFESAQPDPAPVYEMTSPYVPPEVETFYDAQEFVTPEMYDRGDWVVVENKQDRPFEYFDNFYSEPPMANTDTYASPHQEVYSAKDFVETITQHNQVETQEDAESSGNGAHESKHEADCDNSTATHTCTATHTEHHTSDDSSATHMQHNEPADASTDTTASSTDTAASHTVQSHDDESDDKIGLSGDLMQLQISGPYVPGAVGGGYTEQQLDNKDRQYAWERGQIDYLGIDKFENIDSHLKKVIESKNGSSSNVVETEKTDPGSEAAKK